MILSYSVGYYTIQVLLRCLLIFSISYFTCGWLKSLFNESFVSVCAHVMLSLILMLGMILTLGVNGSEREAIGKVAKRFL